VNIKNLCPKLFPLHCAWQEIFYGYNLYSRVLTGEGWLEQAVDGRRKGHNYFNGDLTSLEFQVSATDMYYGYAYLFGTVSCSLLIGVEHLNGGPGIQGYSEDNTNS
jgi:hypothetical protein